MKMEQTLATGATITYDICEHVYRVYVDGTVVMTFRAPTLEEERAIKEEQP